MYYHWSIIQYNTIQYNFIDSIESSVNQTHIDQKDIRFPLIKDKNTAEAEENYFECPFDFEFALLWKRLNFFRREIR